MYTVFTAVMFLQLSAIYYSGHMIGSWSIVMMLGCTDMFRLHVQRCWFLFVFYDAKV